LFGRDGAGEHDVGERLCERSGDGERINADVTSVRNIFQAPVDFNRAIRETSVGERFLDDDAPADLLRLGQCIAGGRFEEIQVAND
jgi:hypothetical protein